MVERKNKKPSCPAVFLSPSDCENKLNAYFNGYLERSGEVADIESLADFLAVTREELFRLRDGEEYGRALRLACNRIAKIKKQLAFSGKLPATVLSFDLRNNHGYTDKQETSDDAATPVIFRGKTGTWAK